MMIGNILCMLTVTVYGGPVTLYLDESDLVGLSQTFFREDSGAIVGTDKSNPDDVFYTNGRSSGFSEPNSGSWKDMDMWRWIEGHAYAQGEDLKNYALHYNPQNRVLSWLVDRDHGNRGNIISVWLLGENISLTRGSPNATEGGFSNAHQRGDFLLETKISYYTSRFGTDAYLYSWQWSGNMPIPSTNINSFFSTTNREALSIEGLEWWTGAPAEYEPYQLVYGWVIIDDLELGFDWNFRCVLFTSEASFYNRAQNAYQRKRIFNALGDFILVPC